MKSDSIFLKDRGRKRFEPSRSNQGALDEHFNAELPGSPTPELSPRGVDGVERR
jgi:hypothetical protein